MNVIVTGNAGFVGRNLTEKLLERGYGVCGFDRVKTKSKAALKHKNFRQKEVNLSSFESVQKACGAVRNVKFIFHTAAMQPAQNKVEISEYLDTNLIGAVNLLKACGARNFRNIIVSSSFSVYGKPEYLPLDEEHPRRPVNIYGLTKLQAELLFEFYARKMDFNVAVLRYDGIYGIGQTISGFIDYLVRSFSKGDDVELFNLGRQKRDYVYVDDVVEANLKAMELCGVMKYSVFNIGGGEPKTSLETAKIVKKAFRSKPRIILSKKKNRLMDYDVFMDITRAKKELEYRPKGLRQNIAKIWSKTRKKHEEGI